MLRVTLIAFLLGAVVMISLLVVNGRRPQRRRQQDLESVLGIVLCPTCGRWLVRIHVGGTFDLNAKTSAQGFASIDTGRFGDSVSMQGLSARCHICQPGPA